MFIFYNFINSILLIKKYKYQNRNRIMRLKDLIGKYIRKLKREDRHSIRTVKSYESDS